MNGYIDMTESKKILSFTRKRGRPKNNRPSIDTGTPETVMKRLQDTTSEILDLCLKYNIINEKQHWCGIHLRWLYTLRYGVPSVRCRDLLYFAEHQTNNTEEDPQWREEREKEFNQAIVALNKAGYAITIVNLCVFNEKPKHFTFAASGDGNKNYHNLKNFATIRNGLDTLADLWKR